MKCKALLFLALMLFSTNSFAQYSDVFGFGSREMAMGGAMTADVQGPAATFYNPGALVKSKGTESFIGYTAVLDFLSLDRTGPAPAGLSNIYLNDPVTRANNIDQIHGIQLGLALPLSKDLVIGSATHLPAKGIADSKFGPPDRPYWLDYESRANYLDMKIAAAYAPVPWFGIGVGVMVLSNIDGSFETSLPIGAGSPAPEPSGPILFSSELEMKFDFAPLAGVWIKPVDFLELGLTYRGQLDIDTHISLWVNTDLNQGAGITQFIPLDIVTRPFFMPQEVAFGGSFKPNNRLTLAADLTWVNWSAYEPPFTDIHVGQLGSTTFGGVPFPPGTVKLNTTPLPDTNFTDTIVPRFGAEFRMLEWLALRGGYFYRPSPVPVQAGQTNIFDANAHVLSGGIGLLLEDPLQVVKGKISFDIHTQFFILEEETNNKIAQLAVLQPNNPGLPGYTEGGFLWAIGFSTGLKF